MLGGPSSDLHYSVQNVGRTREDYETLSTDYSDIGMQSGTHDPSGDQHLPHRLRLQVPTPLMT